MSRPLRIQFPAAVYHVMNRGAARQPTVAGLVRKTHKVTRGEIFRATRGRENEARKVTLYLVKRCCDRTLAEMAQYFGIGNYSTVSWSCRTIATRMVKEKNLRDRIDAIMASIHQLHT